MDPWNHRTPTDPHHWERRSLPTLTKKLTSFYKDHWSTVPWTETLDAPLVGYKNNTHIWMVAVEGTPQSIPPRRRVHVCILIRCILAVLNHVIPAVFPLWNISPSAPSAETIICETISILIGWKSLDAFLNCYVHHFIEFEKFIFRSYTAHDDEALSLNWNWPYIKLISHALPKQVSSVFSLTAQTRFFFQSHTVIVHRPHGPPSLREEEGELYSSSSQVCSKRMCHLHD